MTSIADIVSKARALIAKTSPKLSYGRNHSYGIQNEHSHRRRYDVAVMREVDRLLAEAGIPCEVGLATATSGNPAAPKPKPVAPGPKHTKRMTDGEFLQRLYVIGREQRDGGGKHSVFVAPRPLPPGMRLVLVKAPKGVDAIDAAVELADDTAEYLGAARGYHLFAVGQRKDA